MSTNSKYLQSKEESVALLKLVIAQMSQNDAPFHPETFAVWYEHLAGINPMLSLAMAAAQKEHGKLGRDVVERLYRDHVADPDAEATDRVRAGFGQVMQGLSDAAATTGRDAATYGTQLAGLTKVLAAEAGAGGSALSPQLSVVVDGTAQMQETVSTLQRSVADAQSEIEALRRDLERSRVEAVTDALSGLLNRKGLDEAMRELLSQRPASGSTHCLVMIDIDHFKRVNDSYGHPVGDTVIEMLGQVLRKVASGPGLHAARFGGEEFAVLMQNTTAQKAAQLASAVCTLVRSMKIRRRGSQEVVTQVTVSAGVAAWVVGDDARSLIAAADGALYRAKEAGRDRVIVA